MTDAVEQARAHLAVLARVAVTEATLRKWFTEDVAALLQELEGEHERES